MDGPKTVYGKIASRRAARRVMAAYCLALVVACGAGVMQAGRYRLMLPVLLSGGGRAQAHVEGLPGGAPATPTGVPACGAPEAPGHWLCVGGTLVPYPTPTAAPDCAPPADWTGPWVCRGGTAVPYVTATPAPTYDPAWTPEPYPGPIP